MIGDILRELRTKKGVTQDDIAELLKMKRQTYSAYERNVSLPDITTVKILAEYYNTSLNHLLEIDESTNKNTHLSETDRRVQQLFEEKPIMHDLVHAISRLDESQQQALLEYAEFQAQKYKQKD